MRHDEMLLFGERIRNARNLLVLTQEYVANEIGISLRFFQMIERGEKSLSLDTLMRLSTTLKVSIDYLLFGTPSNNLSNPITNIYEQLTPEQREDATNILRLYFKGCQGKSLGGK